MTDPLFSTGAGAGDNLLDGRFADNDSRWNSPPCYVCDLMDKNVMSQLWVCPTSNGGKKTIKKYGMSSEQRWNLGDVKKPVRTSFGTTA